MRCVISVDFDVNSLGGTSLNIKLAGVLVPLALWAVSSKADSDIRSVDFQNFTYHPTLCAKEFGAEGIGTSVRVRNGEWTGKEAYYAVSERSPIYADLSGDVREEAIVETGCAPTGANYSLFETLIFRMDGDKPSLVTVLDQSQLEGAYRKLYPNGILWVAGFEKVASDRRTLVFGAAADGAHCCPEHSVTFEYQLKAGRLVPVGKPTREPFKK